MAGDHAIDLSHETGTGLDKASEQVSKR